VDCSYCKCPDFFSGSNCLQQYITLTATVSGSPTMSLYYLGYNLERELNSALVNGEVDLSVDIVAKGSALEMTVTFTGGTNPSDYGLRRDVRALVVKALQDPSSAIFDYYYGSWIQLNTVKTQDPPDQTPPSSGPASVVQSSASVIIGLFALLLAV